MKYDLETFKQMSQEIESLKKENQVLTAKFNKFESGSNKSALNIHKEGKKHLQDYIDKFEPYLETTGEFCRRAIEDRTGLQYEDIISGSV
jgi:hypothetical protein